MAIGTTNFPTALDTASTLVEATNNASSTLTGAITNSQNTIPIADPGEFPDTGFATIVDSLTSPTKLEIISYTGKSGSDLTGVTRGAQGTSGTAFDSGNFVELRYTKGMHEALRGAIIALETKLGYGSDTAANGQVLIGNGAGTSEWRALIAGDIPDLSGTYATAGHNHSGVYQPVDADLTAIAALSNDGFLKKTGGTWGMDSTAYGTGTVTSVALSLPAILSVSGSPITTSGTFTVTLADQAANVVLAGPTTGAATTPAFRALVAADIPGVLSITKASNLTSNGFVKTSGGDGTLSVDTATYLTGNQSISLSGDVTGSGTTAITTTIASAAVTYAKMQNVSAQYRIWARKSASAGSVEECTLSEVLDFVTSAAQGDILYRGASGWARLGAGTNGHFLKTQGAAADPVWAAVAGGGTPGGTNTQLQYNNSSAFGGITGATSDGTNVTFGSTNLRATSPQISTSLTTDSASFDLLNATATTINFGGAATALNMAGGSGAVVKIGGGANAAELRFLEPSGSGTNYTAFKAQAQAGDITYTLPASITNGYYLQTDGSGNLSWAAVAGGGITVGTTTVTSGTNTRVLYNNSGVVGEYAVTGSGNVVMSTGPTLTDFTLSGNISAAAWTTSGVRIKGVASTLTDTTSSGTVAAAVTNALGGNTIAASNSTTYTDYFTTRMAPATAGTNVTITRNWALGLTGGLQVAPAARTGSPARGFQLITPADTALTASTENIFAQFGGDATAATVTRTWAAGTVASQSENVFVAPTYGGASATATFTTAATVKITGAPAVGPNAAITTPLALWVQSGASRFAGVVEAQATIVLSQPSSTLSNVIYAGLVTGAVDNNVAVMAAGNGTPIEASKGPVMGMRGNLYSALGGQRGNLFFLAGAPIAPATTEGQIRFITGSGETPRIVATLAGLIGIGAISDYSTLAGSSIYVTSGAGAPVGVNNLSPSAQLHAISGSASRVGLRVDSAANTTVALNQFYLDSNVGNAVVQHSLFNVSSGTTVAAGFGGQLLFQSESSTTANRDAAAVNWLWSTETDASRTAALSFSTVQNAGSLTERARLTFDGTRSHFILGNGATAASPTSGLVQATSGSGTDIAGADLILAGGQPTGSGTPGQVLRKYSLVGATGTTLRSLSSNNYNIPSIMFTSTADASVANTTSETSILGTGVGTATVEAGMWRMGRTFRIRVVGYISSASTPTMRIRWKVGSVTVADTTATTMVATTGNEWFEAFIELNCRTIGATGTVMGQGAFRYHAGSGSAALSFVEALNTSAVTIDTTVANAIDVTAEWGTANANNIITGTNTIIEIFN